MSSSKLLIYTREPMESDIYDPKLAYSMHIAVKNDGGVTVLNHNSGVFFAKATENQNGSLNAKSLRSPYAVRLGNESGWGVIAVRTEADGSLEPDSCGCLLLAKTEDFIHFKELGLLKLSDSHIERAAIFTAEGESSCKIVYKTEDGVFCSSLDSFSPESNVSPCEPEGLSLPEPSACGGFAEGSVLSCEIPIPDSLAEELIKRLTTPCNTSVIVPDTVYCSSESELAGVKAVCLYSDGSKDEKAVDWELSCVDFNKPGSYTVNGRIKQDHYPFPIAINRADPCVTIWEGKYYFIATNDADGNNSLYIRCADSLHGLIDAEEVLLLDTKTQEGIKGLLWAPEFHEIDGRLYIFHAATTGHFFCEESHLMVLEKGKDPMVRSNWSDTRRITRADGSELCEAGRTITLDMTVFEWDGSIYAVWSQRQFLPDDLGAWLYIARLNRNDPWRLDSEPVVLSKPDYGWANNHTFVDEGPFALFRDGKLWLSFSSAAVDSTYVVAFLTLEPGQDPLNPECWVKANFPSLSSRSVTGEFGTGHNAYVKDTDGKVYNTYHARPGVNGPRSSGIRRVHFNIYNEPVLDMTEELDIRPWLRDVKTTVIVK